ncbi:hypothetical protein [Actinocorallia longicatena]|uniref:Alpha/beta fold hydrolase n=1 Tax=Actinocorallia longicatena TaxID=111803 RepID=A0ABP6Q7D3_9ACTN
MKRTAATLTVLTAVLGTASPALASPVPASPGGHGRGTLVSATHLTTVSKAKAVKLLKAEGYDPRTVRFGVDTYRLVYRTIDENGRPTRASGLLVLPRRKATGLRTVSWTHGTTSFKGDAPSTSSDGFGLGAPLTYGTAGFATVAPDYLGLGKGPGIHPWMHLPSETSASLDMLRAARRYSPKVGRDVLVTGFSQGASASLGLSRALQRGEDRRFRLRATAPVSGGYDLGGVEIPQLLAGRLDPKLSVIYTTYLLVNWNRRVHLYDDPAEVFRKPYAAKAEKLFDGTVPGEVMFPALPGTIGELLTPHGRRLLARPPANLARALRTETALTCGWRARTPVRLFVMPGDEQAASANTVSCAASLAGERVVRLKPAVYNGSRHLGSNVTATGKIVRWFLTFR